MSDSDRPEQPEKTLCPVCGTPLHEGPHAVPVPAPGRRGRRPTMHKPCGELRRALNRLHGFVTSGEIPFDRSESSDRARRFIQSDLRLISNQLCAKPVTPIEKRYGLDLSDGRIYRVSNSKGESKVVRFDCSRAEGRRLLVRSGGTWSPIADATWLRWADAGSSAAAV